MIEGHCDVVLSFLVFVVLFGVVNWLISETPSE